MKKDGVVIADENAAIGAAVDRVTVEGATCDIRLEEKTVIIIHKDIGTEDSPRAVAIDTRFACLIIRKKKILDNMIFTGNGHIKAVSLIAADDVIPDDIGGDRIPHFQAVRAVENPIIQDGIAGSRTAEHNTGTAIGHIDRGDQTIRRS